MTARRQAPRCRTAQGAGRRGAPLHKGVSEHPQTKSETKRQGAPRRGAACLGRGPGHKCQVSAGRWARRDSGSEGKGGGAPLSDLDQHVADVHVAGLRRGVQRGALVLVLHLEVGVDSVNCGRTGFSDYSRASH